MSGDLCMSQSWETPIMRQPGSVSGAPPIKFPIKHVAQDVRPWEIHIPSITRHPRSLPSIYYQEDDQAWELPSPLPGTFSPWVWGEGNYPLTIRATGKQSFRNSPHPFY